MCGICGLADLAGHAGIDPEALEEMSVAMVHRGPDSDGRVLDGPVGLAARRLAIIDLMTGDQPVASEDGRVHAVLNGELYNYAALRAELEERGHRFASQGDTEVLVHLYEEHGPAFVRELRGMFALALWDSRQRRVVLARDRFGIKPLYHATVDGRLAFASELWSLARAPGFRRDVDPDALEALLTFNAIPGPLSIYAGARKLLPGHVLVWEQGGAPRAERYARPSPARVGELRREDPEELARELRERLLDSVRAHLIADVPVGVLLSGGVDSATIVALAAEASDHPVRTFSIGFEESSFNELDLARQVADRYATDHHELVVRPDAVDLIEKVATAYDEPSGDSSALPTYLVCELAASEVKVALSGEGGDELFGGYETYSADLLAHRLGAIPGLAAPLVERLPSSSARVSLDYRLKRFVRGAGRPPLERHHAWKEIFAPERRAELLRRRGAHDPLDVQRARYAETTGDTPLLARLQDVDLGIYLVDDLLAKTDRMSMAHSLEARVPFLDPVVAELALALPTALKVRGLSKKRLLKRAAAPLIPPGIVAGRKKGFSIPAAAWLRGELVPFARDVLSPGRVARQGFLDPSAVTAVLDAHVDGREDLSRQLWGLMSFSLWCDRAGVTA